MPPRGMKNGSSRSIKFDWDQSEFEQNVKKLLAEIPEKVEDILIKTAPEFSKAAAKYTPPNMGKNSIDKKYYTRPVFALLSLIKGYYKGQKATPEDIKAFRSGMKYKILDTKAGVTKGKAYAYCKNKGEIKKLAQISTRGISRIMWRKRIRHYWS
jgi:hypothetical protein